ncbi:hypothetical protein LXA43DRAFT_716444 [Ganoderma leucocontextum]|nr:hypothetical protein LXA43DRAFT_716444 [Ganoderma leucocontextum]
MTVVIPTSRGLTIMSSAEHSETAMSPDIQAPGVDDVAETDSETVGRPSVPFRHSPIRPEAHPPTTRRGIAAMSDIGARHYDPHFIDNHLTAVPSSFALSEELRTKADGIAKAGEIEAATYRPLQTLLTCLSKDLHGTLEPQLKDKLRRAHCVPDGIDGHLVFLDLHKSPPTHFPVEALRLKAPPKAQPDLLGAYGIDMSDPPATLPYHRVEAIVEAKAADKYAGLDQAASYAYLFHQARPDHPACYSLIVKPEWYQVIVSEPSGIISSPKYNWGDLSLLIAYVYSHYVPPSNHTLIDETIRWDHDDSGSDRLALPTWSIRCGTRTFSKGTLLFIGSPWRRRTSVFKVVTVTADKRNLTMVIKDSFRHFRCRFKEEDILRHIHRDGDVPGVVRFEDSEELAIFCGSNEKGDLRTRVRMSLWDSGESLLAARTVNNLLKAVYDALEVHRMLYCERNVLHRDMSISNILMYPQRAEVTGRRMMCDERAPKLIEDVLWGETRPGENRQACCLLIDVGNAAILDKRIDPSVSDPELEHRTGTPMFIARSVCVGSLFISSASVTAVGMPELTGDALHRYNTVHGPARYDKYPPELKMGGAKQHGFTPPPPIHPPTFQSNLTYVHRPEHDVESVFWTMLYALLLVKPKDGKAEKNASPAFGRIWDTLNSHSIEENPGEDCRNVIFDCRISTWMDAFDESMRDVGVMLCNIANQVKTEWALWESSARTPDHLHEAFQRIILQYLVDHSDKDVTLLPGQTRPTNKPRLSLRTETSTADCTRRRLIDPPVKTKSPATSGTSPRLTGKKRKEREGPATAGPSTVPTTSAHPAQDDDEPSRARKRRKSGRKTRGDAGEGNETPRLT